MQTGASQRALKDALVVQISISDYSRAASAGTNHKWAHPFCYIFHTHLCRSSLHLHLWPHWSNTLRQLKIIPLCTVLQLQRERYRYDRGWLSLCVCGGHLWHPASSAAEAEPGGATACRGGTEAAVRAGELGVVRHGHRSLLHLPSLPTCICEYRPHIWVCACLHYL